MNAETLDLIFSILEYTIAALMGYASGKWKNILVFIADLIPILRKKLPPVYEKPLSPWEYPARRWEKPGGDEFLRKPIKKIWIV